ncbi:MAG TPA: hypothetical protein ENG50_03785 [Candidatus Altiarchaeales archaeon]|nr:hypothetical protein [Candidatus Altiarchaeales archaeon]
MENEEKVGIRLDVMHDIIHYLDESPELRKILGEPVSKYLVLVADNNDLRIEEGGAKKLSKEEIEIFLEVLREAIDKFTRD